MDLSEIEVTLAQVRLMSTARILPAFYESLCAAAARQSPPTTSPMKPPESFFFDWPDSSYSSALRMLSHTCLSFHCSKRVLENSKQNYILSRGARRGGRGGDPPPPPTEKIVVEKWYYFPEVYKMTKVLEDGIENWEKVHFPLRFLYVNLNIFSKNFNLHWFLPKGAKIYRQAS